MTDRFRVYSAVFLILRKDDQVLLHRRRNSGYYDGSYGLVSGHIDGNEPFIEALQREAKEEAGIRVGQKDVRFVHAMHRSSPDDGREYVDMFFEATTWRGEPQNMEPHKCDELSWHPLDNLPDNIVPSVKAALENYRKGECYTEFGW